MFRTSFRLSLENEHIGVDNVLHVRTLGFELQLTLP